MVILWRTSCWSVRRTSSCSSNWTLWDLQDRRRRGGGVPLGDSGDDDDSSGPMMSPGGAESNPNEA
ncbi:hypothetical protein EYF80_024507 [Liparis tanakae]|uniref:Uncharacterized protein n=1 Tax=Liparis tanakae TaxID=230148 RepID=A0A4Z2HH84_9TELE|nr:hypothetical protein EYF80_024507 [Liparis tanakae]